MYKYILWDNDGVLVDTEGLFYRTTRRVFEELGLELEEDAYHARMIRGETNWTLARAAGIAEDVVQAAIARRDEYYRQALQNEPIDIPGVAETLQALAADYSMAIVTTADSKYFGWIHAGRRLVDHMDFVLTYEDYPRAKPAPDPYLCALERFRASPAEAVVVEDTERGLRSAVAAGIDCIIVDNAFSRGHDFSAAKHIIGSVSELPEVLHA